MAHSSPVEMQTWEKVYPIALRNAGDITRAFIELGVSDLRAAAQLVQSFPYARNSRPDSPLVVLDEKCGTCSTKHALIQLLANEQNIPMSLIVGIYEMSTQNTPGIGEVLKRHRISSIPEAHCYLRFRGRRIDLTGLPHTRRQEPIQRFLLEEAIEPDEITDYKVWLHKRVLESWSTRRPFMRYTTRELWSIREECIQALSIERPGSAGDSVSGNDGCFSDPGGGQLPDKGTDRPSVHGRARVPDLPEPTVPRDPFRR